MAQPGEGRTVIEQRAEIHGANNIVVRIADERDRVGLKGLPYLIRLFTPDRFGSG